MHPVRFVAVLLLSAAIPATALPAAAQDANKDGWAKFQPYKSVFSLRPGAMPDGGEAVRMTGRMEMETKMTCADVTTAVAMSLRITGGAQTMTAEFDQTMTESRDGKVYRFSTKSIENGRISEQREGQAVLESPDGPGEGTIKVAASESIKLDRGTVLPSTHMLRLLANAAAGKTEFQSRVFYGMDQMKLTDVHVTVKSKGNSPKTAGLGDFADKPGWTIREEYREVGGPADGQPQATEAFYTEDGVPVAIKVTVQGLEIIGTPLSVEKLPKPQC